MKNRLLKTGILIAALGMGVTVSLTELNFIIHNKQKNIFVENQKINNTLVSHNITLDKQSEFRSAKNKEQIIAGENKVNFKRGSGWGNGIYGLNAENGKFTFDLGHKYEEVSIDQEIAVNGRYSQYYSFIVIWPPVPFPENVLANSKERFHFKGSVKKGEEASIGKGQVKTILDTWGYDNSGYETLNWKMSLNKEGNKLTIFSDSPKSSSSWAEGNQAFVIDQLYGDNGNEYHNTIGNGSAYMDFYDNEPPIYQDNVKLNITGYTYDVYDAVKDNFVSGRKGEFQPNGDYLETGSKYNWTDESSENLKNLKLNSGQGLKKYENPYLTSDNTYQNIEDYIREHNLIESRDDVPLENMNITFYDEDNKEIEKSTNLNTAKINIKYISKKEGEDNFNENVIGETDIIKGYKIPFVEFRNFDSIDGNVFDFDGNENNDVTDNESSGNWYWNGSNWVYKTNMPKEFSLNEDYIESIKVNGNLTNDNIDVFKFENKLLKEDNSGVVDKQIDKITINNKDGYEWKFNIEFLPENHNDYLKVIPSKDNGVDNIIGKQNTKRVFDKNNDEILNDDEIINSTIVDGDFTVSIDDKFSKNLRDGNLDYIVFKWDRSKNYWVKELEIQDPNYKFENDGIYGFSLVDIYGNNSFEVVQKVKKENNSYTNKSYNENEIKLYDYSENINTPEWVSQQYEKDLNLAKDQSTVSGSSASENFKKMLVHELRKVNALEQGDGMKDLSAAKIDKSELEEISSSWNEGVNFLQVKESLKEEIDRQMINSENGYDKNSYKIIWKGIEDNDKVSYGDKIGLDIIPGSNWKSRGEWNSKKNDIELKPTGSLNGLSDQNSEMFSTISNNFEEGQTLDKLIDKGIEKQIIDGIVKKGMSKKLLEDYLIIDWKNNESSSIINFNDELKIKLSSKDEKYLKGEKEFIFNSKTWKNLKKVK
ncbi:MAG: hypothetical protein HRS50_00135, partial [Mycoplasmataceae bacterium]|nr:hypothetical protein [Mycoplasmataceae bacterium]